MKEIIFEVTEDQTDGGFVARALGHSIVTQADSWDELKANVREAVLSHFDEGKAPPVIRLHRVVDEVVALHRSCRATYPGPRSKRRCDGLSDMRICGRLALIGAS